MRNVIVALIGAGLTGNVVAQETKKMILREGWDDLPARDYSDLYMEMPDIQPENNGLPELGRIANVLQERYPLFQGVNPKIDQYSELKSAEQAEALADKIYKEIQPLYKQMDKALAKKHLIEKHGFTINSSCPNSLSMIALSRYLSLRACKLADEGKESDALAAFGQQLLLTKKLRAHTNSLVTVLITSALETGQISTADYLLSKFSDSSKLREAIFSRLREPVNYKKELGLAMKSEMFVTYKIVDSFSMGDFKNIDGEDKSYLKKISLWDAYLQPSIKGAREKKVLNAYKHFSGIFFQPNKTLDFGYRNYQVQCEMIAMTPSEIVNFDSRERDDSKLRTKFKPKVSSNILGSALIAISSPIINKQIIRVYTAPQVVSLLEARHALRSYRADHGRLPVKLTELVPKYMEKIPVDIFSKNLSKIKYDRKKAMVWSVGVDGKDDFEVLKKQGYKFKKGDNVSAGVIPQQPHLFVD